MKQWITTVILLYKIVTTCAQTGLVWTQVTEINNQLPSEIRYYQTSGVLENKKVTAYYTITDLSSNNYIFYPVLVPVSKNVNEIYNQFNNEAVVITNGGYFSGDASYSLIINDGNTLAPNIKALNRTYNGSSLTYYPTRSAFGISSNLQAKAGYVYTLGAKNFTYIYPEASPNSTLAPPQPVPTETFPAGAQIWNVQNAIGGGPLLIHNGIINNNYTPELFLSDITDTYAPRTAIGITADGKLINIVVDGRQSHSDGVSLKGLSDILYELGCVEAVNLDGGGSSALNINGTLINKPSDGVPRKTPTSVVVLKVSAFFDTEDIVNFIKTSNENSVAASGAFGNSGTLLFTNQSSNTDIAVYKFGGLVSAEYKIEIFLNGSVNNSVSDSVDYIICRGALGRTKVNINQNVSNSGFISLGNYHLSSADSLLIVNKQNNKSVQIDAIRFFKIGQSKPAIKLDPPSSAKTHATNEIIKLKAIANTGNTGKTIHEFKIYEIIGSAVKQLYTKSGLNTFLYTDSITYKVAALSGEMRVRFVTKDNNSDSATIDYIITIRNNIPEIVFGSASVLTGKVNDSLHFELVMSPASGTRPLKELRISKEINGVKNQLFLETYNQLYINYNFSYKIVSEDAGMLKLIFEIEDNAGYIGTKEFLLQVTSVSELNTRNINVFYNKSDKKIHITNLTSENLTNYSIQIYDAGGKLLVTAPKISVNGQISADNLMTGIYILKFTYSGTVITKKIFIQ